MVDEVVERLVAREDPFEDRSETFLEGVGATRVEARYEDEKRVKGLCKPVSLPVSLTG